MNVERFAAGGPTNVTIECQGFLVLGELRAETVLAYLPFAELSPYYTRSGVSLYADNSFVTIFGTLDWCVRMW